MARRRRRSGAVGPLAALSLLLASAPALQEAGGAPIAIVHVSVLSMDDAGDDAGDGVLADRTVIVRDGRIAAVTPAAEARVPEDALVVDGRGKFLMPGLADMHVHLADPRDGLLYVANGVTTIRNLSGQPLHLDLARAFERGEYVGPTLVSSGPQVRPAADATPEEVAAVVREHHAQGYASVKVYGRTSLECYEAMAAASRDVGIPLVGHVPRNLTLEQVLGVGGQREISHAEETLYSFFYERDEPAEEVLAECVELLKEADVTVTATLAVYRDIAPQVEDLEAFLTRPEMRSLPPLAHAIFGPLNKYTAFDEDDVARCKRGTEILFLLTGALHEAGVPILLGTDAMNPAVVPGYSIHDELEALVEAGLSPREALAAGTTAAAAFWGASDELGRVAPGLRADLVLLDANPLEDVAGFRRLHGVCLRGEWHTRASLEAALEEQIAGYAAERAALAGLDVADPGRMLAAIAAAGEEGLPPEGFFLAVDSAYRLIGSPQAARAVVGFAVEHHPDSWLLRNRLAELE